MSKRGINFNFPPSTQMVLDELSEEAYQAVSFDAGRAFQIGIFSHRFNLTHMNIKEWKKEMKQADTGHRFYKNDAIVALLHGIYKEGCTDAIAYSRDDL